MLFFSTKSVNKTKENPNFSIFGDDFCIINIKMYLLIENIC